MAFRLYECMLTNNDCYKTSQKMVPKGIVVHSTGANNPYLKRYVQPDDGFLGVNTNNNSWNRPGVDKAVHCMIGKDKNQIVKCYQTLPFDICAWGVGRGSKGSYNYNPAYLQFEIQEDNLADREYFNEAFDLAAELCAFWMKQYNIDISKVVSHEEAYLQGMASGHHDPHNWLSRFGLDMNWFRNLVLTKLGDDSKEPEASEPTKPDEPSPEPEQAQFVYTVEKGDNLTKIAVRYKTTVDAIMKMNPSIKNRSLIYPGQKIVVPNANYVDDTKPVYYTAKQGDTVTKLSKQFKVPAAQIVQLNGLTVPYWLYAGRVYRIK